MNMELPPWMQLLTAQLTSFGLKLLGAIVVWIVGRRLIALAVRLDQHARQHPHHRRQQQDPLRHDPELLRQPLHDTVDPAAAIKLLRERLPRIPNVLADPAPQLEILQFTPAGPFLAVRPFCHNDSYWQVYFDTNRAIRETFAAAGYSAPEQLVLVRSGT
jgi:hypothetical protein